MGIFAAANLVFTSLLMCMPTVIVMTPPFDLIHDQNNTENSELLSPMNDYIPDNERPVDKHLDHVQGDSTVGEMYRTSDTGGKWEVFPKTNDNQLITADTAEQGTHYTVAATVETFGDMLKVVGDLDESVQISKVNEALDGAAASAPKIREVLRLATHQSPFLVEGKDGRKPLFMYIEYLVDHIRPAVTRIRDILEQEVQELSGSEDIAKDHEVLIAQLGEFILEELPEVGEILKILGDGVPNGKDLSQMGVEDVQSLPQVASDVMDKAINISHELDIESIKEGIEENINTTPLIRGIMERIRTVFHLPQRPKEYAPLDMSRGNIKEITHTSNVNETSQKASKSTSDISTFHKLAKDKKHGSCSNKWIKVLKTNEWGVTIFGRKSWLQIAILHGSRVRFEAELHVDPGYSAELDNCQLINKDVCCQNLMHISKSGWELFQKRSYWWMNSICTTGNWQMVRYYVGGNYMSQRKLGVAISWFVTRPAKGKGSKPVLSTRKDGKVVSGSSKALAAAVKKGYSVRVVADRKFLYPVQNVELFSGRLGVVSAESIWRVSQGVTGNHIEISDNAFWTFNLLTSQGSQSMSGWTLGSHVSRKKSTQTVSLDWFVDSCWKKVYKSDEKGKKGNLKKLRQAVEDGHSVKVQIGNTFIEADSVRISNEEVSAQFVSSLRRKNQFMYEDDLFWQFRVVNTKGTVRTYRPLVGDPSRAPQGNTVEQERVTWFVDTRKWVQLLQTDSNGNVVSGSKTWVRLAVKLGADLRVGIKKADDIGFRYIRVDNAEFSPRGSAEKDTAVQLIRLLWELPAGEDEYKLEYRPCWSFQCVNTRGDLRTTRWTVGEHANQGRTTEKVEVKWFACF